MPPANTYGLVICGGKSTRMGSDKGLLTYYNKPQCYYLYEMLGQLCSKVFISCNAAQAHQFSSAYNIMPDLKEYGNTGPVAALLTAFDYYPQSNFLAVGCDYPFITAGGLQPLLNIEGDDAVAAALYNDNGNVYEPLLAWYANKAGVTLQRLFVSGKYSLQYFLKEVNAIKVAPMQQKMIISVDTPEAFALIKRQLLKDEQ